MKIDGKPFRTIWPAGSSAIEVIDQTKLPHRFETQILDSADECARAIREMVVRGAPLIGATAAYGIALAMQVDASDEALDAAHDMLLETRPTAVNLRWALKRMCDVLRNHPRADRAKLAWAEAAKIADEDVETCRSIGEHGLKIIQNAAAKKKPDETLNILTHCNAGWLATVDWGTATAPIYLAHDAGLAVHVWVDETRPRNQGASLTAWELLNHGVPHTVIVDNAGGHLMQRGAVDVAIVGTDRTTARGDVCNKIGTYLKALAARDNGVPFYVAAPSPSIDWAVRDGILEIPIENRPESEVTHISGRLADGRVATVALAPEGSGAANPAFDVTPARLVTGLVTERGIAEASEAGLRSLFPEHYAPNTYERH